MHRPQSLSLQCSKPALAPCQRKAYASGVVTARRSRPRRFPPRENLAIQSLAARIGDRPRRTSPSVIGSRGDSRPRANLAYQPPAPASVTDTERTSSLLATRFEGGPRRTSPFNYQATRDSCPPRENPRISCLQLASEEGGTSPFNYQRLATVRRSAAHSSPRRPAPKYLAIQLPMTRGSSPPPWRSVANLLACCSYRGPVRQPRRSTGSELATVLVSERSSRFNSSRWRSL